MYNFTTLSEITEHTRIIDVLDCAENLNIDMNDVLDVFYSNKFTDIGVSIAKNLKLEDVDCESVTSLVYDLNKLILKKVTLGDI